jgi:ketosteroid isomerase-like protein
MRTACFCLLLLAAAVVMPAAAQKQIDEPSILMQADRDFDAAVAQRGVDAWVEFFAPNGSMISDTLPPVTGRADIRKRMAPAFADTSFSLRWHPTRAEMLIPGVIGYTVGRYDRYKNDASGNRRHSTGTYTTVWMRQPDGSWKAVLDTGEDDSPRR